MYYWANLKGGSMYLALICLSPPPPQPNDLSSKGLEGYREVFWQVSS